MPTPKGSLRLRNWLQNSKPITLWSFQDHNLTFAPKPRGHTSRRHGLSPLPGPSPVRYFSPSAYFSPTALTPKQQFPAEGLWCFGPLGPLGFNSPNIAQRHALHVERTAEKAQLGPSGRARCGRQTKTLFDRKGPLGVLQGFQNRPHLGS